MSRVHHKHRRQRTRRAHQAPPALPKEIREYGRWSLLWQTWAGGASQEQEAVLAWWVEGLGLGEGRR